MRLGGRFERGERQVCAPPPPQQVFLTAGERTLFIDATTNDSLYHFEAFYQFDLSFEAV